MDVVRMSGQKGGLLIQLNAKALLPLAIDVF